MIRIRASHTADGLDIVARGHAGYAPAGQDIVCAGVSALLWGLLSYLESEVAAHVVGVPVSERPTVVYRVGNGLIRLSTRGMQGIDLAAWAVTAAGLELISTHYPHHIRLTHISYRKENHL